MMSEELVVFSVEGRRLAFRVACVREIVRAVALSPYLTDCAEIEGLLNLRGDSIPVYDLRTILGLAPRSMSLDDYLIIFATDQQMGAIRSDQGVELRTLTLGAVTQSQLGDDRLKVDVISVEAKPIYLLEPDSFAAIDQQISASVASNGGNV